MAEARNEPGTSVRSGWASGVSANERAFVVANAAVASDKQTLVFLSTEGVRLSQQEYADDIREQGFAPLKELMDNFVKAGGLIWVCSPCFKRRKLDEGKLIGGATIVGGAKLVEFLSDGSPSITY